MFEQDSSADRLRQLGRQGADKGGDPIADGENYGGDSDRGAAVVGVHAMMAGIEQACGT